ncbi:MAG: cobaltochelatase subunit CobN, partial [Rhodospirillaceae bacterium]|nr:cobaltochelatase subunit CobN [Rhodospirillaceae bacterium]
MHLLAAQPGGVMEKGEAVDLGQSPGDIVVLSAADSEIACLATAHELITDEQVTQAGENGGIPSLRLANFMNLSHNLSVDLFVENIVSKAKLVVIRLLGGVGYWPYGAEQIASACRQHNIPLAFLPGDDQPDAGLNALSTLNQEAAHRLWQYGVHGGIENAVNFIRYAADLISPDAAKSKTPWIEPAALMRAGLYWPGQTTATLDDIRQTWREGAPIAAIVFYRALVQAANTTPIDALIVALAERGLNPLPLFATSLKDPMAAALIAGIVENAPPDVILNGTGFALSTPGGEFTPAPFNPEAAPVLQIVFAGMTEDAWVQGLHGLSPRDLAMNVALPEVDGRIFTRALSFKEILKRDDRCQCDIIAYKPRLDRINFTADLALAWTELRRTPAHDRRVAMVLANYPNKDGRLGNGVGLDTPAGAIKVLKAMEDAGYDVTGRPSNGAELIERLASGPTNDFADLANRNVSETFSLSDYQRHFDALPESLRRAVEDRWGAPDTDPFVQTDGFALPCYRIGNVTICLQPARGFNIDPKSTYHSPDLVPPHNYFAFYFWLRNDFKAQAIIHMGKHGNLEWLPGKALALSQECYPEATLGPMPHLYPFIVNDPGEGTQAKRRSGAVIIDHLTPPLTRAESYGALAEIEQLADEYYEASGLDPRRIEVLSRDIIEKVQLSGLDIDCGINKNDNETTALAKLDAYLCDLKEMQIRDGLHIFGQSPEDDQMTDLLVALLRTPRGTGEAADASLIRALADDLGLGGGGFDPLDCNMGKAWNGPRPPILADGPLWRLIGDTVERLEKLARSLVSGENVAPPEWTRTRAILAWLESDLRGAVERCGTAEISGIIDGLSGRFVTPGPSGAPTRGRPDVLPTGRNFYSVDTRTVPTPSAWQLGWKSAQRLVERHAQENGDWPKRLALSVWGTSNMRTGGDDIAQALALLGAQPVWEPASRRVTGFEILPLSLLDRPRVDVTLRISGFFRDAFPGLVDLFDSAVAAVAALDEGPQDNPLAERVRLEAATFEAQGLTHETAFARASTRVFGSMPGAYGAGLQALIDESGWTDSADLARAYVAWGGYAYGGARQGKAEHTLFNSRLKGIEAVVHNQD